MQCKIINHCRAGIICFQVSQKMRLNKLQVGIYFNLRSYKNELYNMMIFFQLSVKKANVTNERR